jgi:hypothetical protein
MDEYVVGSKISPSCANAGITGVLKPPFRRMRAKTPWFPPRKSRCHNDDLTGTHEGGGWNQATRKRCGRFSYGQSPARSSGQAIKHLEQHGKRPLERRGTDFRGCLGKCPTSRLLQPTHNRKPIAGTAQAAALPGELKYQQVLRRQVNVRADPPQKTTYPISRSNNRRVFIE